MLYLIYTEKGVDMKKKKVIVVIIFVVIFIILFFPKREVNRDGGTTRYKSLVYEIIKYHELNSNYQLGYKTGLQVKMLGFLVYDKVKNPDVANQNETNQRVIKVGDQLYFEVESEKENFDYCGIDYLDGKITSNVDFSKLPIENEQSNFEGTYNYKFLNKKVIMACSDNETLYFKLKEDNVVEEIVDGNLDINSNLVMDLYDKANPSEDISILKGIYEKDNTFSNDYILTVAITNLIKEHQWKDKEYINKEDVEQQIYKFFGKDISFCHQEVLMFSKNAFGKGICGYSYLEDKNQYQLKHGCGGNWFEFFRRKLVSAEKQGDYIYLTEKSIYFTNDWDDELSRITIYNNYAREKKLNYFVKSSQESIDVLLDDYMEQASTYVYTFHKLNDQYIFEGIKRLKN